MGCGAQEEEASVEVTWYRDVLPVAQRSCMGCHNDQAPTFSMQQWSDALAGRAQTMAFFTAERVMPPWKPSGDCNDYVGERTLTEEEIALFTAWAEGGAVAGDPGDAPPATSPRAGLGRVDVSLEMAEPYLPAPPQGEVDDLHCFVLDPQLTEQAYVAGYDVRPGESRVVHHALLYLADGSEADALDAAEPGPGYGCFGGPMASSAKVVAGWVPGMPANSFPEGTAIALAANSRFILQIHYNTMQAGPLPDRTSVDLQLTDGAPDVTAQLVSLSKNDFRIPAMTQGYTATSDITVPASGRVWASAAHMHLLGRRQRIEIEHAGGARSCLLDIPDWDFDWQQLYFLEQPVSVAPGDRVHVECTWDNATSTEVTFGEGTESEMCVSVLYVTAD